MTARINGIIPAIVTPLTAEDEVDDPALRAHVGRMLEAGAHGVFPGGTNGEFFALSSRERQHVLEIVVDEVGGRVPVYAGTGAITTRAAVELSTSARDAGADVLSVITPYFAVATQDELYRHFRTVAESVDLPVVLYNIPARTGNGITPATVAKLAEIDNIVGVKDSSGDFDTILQYIERTPNDFAVLSGNDSLILWALLGGGVGAITGIANVYPTTMVGIYDAWKAGDQELARVRQDSIRTIRNCFRHGNPNTVVKAAADIAHGSIGPCRPPFDGLGDAALDDIRSVVEADRARGLH